MHPTRWIASAACAGLLLAPGTGTLARSAAPAAAADRERGDRAFLRRALGVNALELRLGRLASERAATPDSRAKAKKMVENHTNLERRLGELARQAGLGGDPQMSSEEKATLRRVASEPPSRFDSTFQKTVDAGHVRELAMYQDEVSRAESAALRAFAEQRVAALQQAVADARARSGAAR